MITVHNRTETVFTTNGYGALDHEIIAPQIIEEIGGDYSLTFTYPADGKLAKRLILENIIAAPVPSPLLRQGFRICQVRTTLDGMLEVTCLHVSFDLAANLIADTFVVNKTPKPALAQILTAAQYSHGFTATSADTATVSSARIVRTSLLAAIMDGQTGNSFISRWGGEIRRDNWLLHHAPRLGTDKGVVIRDQKNLTGYQADIDNTTVTTRVLPVGYDGLLLPELYVDSPRLGDYQYPLVRVVKFDQIKAIQDESHPREDELPLPQAQTALRQAASTYLALGADLPSATYSINFVELSQTAEYSQFAALETVALGDTVTVIHADFGVNLSARVTAYTYNPQTLGYMSVDLGGVAPKFSSVTRTVEKIRGEVSDALATAETALTSADGKTTNHYGPSQPARAALGDTWFRQNGELIEIWIYTLTDDGSPDWVAVATDLNQAQLAADLAEARGEVLEAADKAEDARQTAEQTALELAAKAGEISEAKTAAQDAETKAQAALDAAGLVQTYSEQVADDLADVQITAESALATAQDAQSAAQTVTAGLETANSEIAAAKAQAVDAETKAIQALGAAAAVDTYAQGVATELAGVKTTALNAKAKADTVETATTVIRTDLTATAQATTAARGRADNAYTLATTANNGVTALALTVAAEDERLESQISVIAGDVNLRVTKGEVIAQINISPETILIDGKRIHITGTTLIDNAVIKTAMIADAAITNAKIGALDAGKITTGYLAAARIQAGAITSDKLTIATGFIQTAMIADAAISNAKIGGVDAGKITTGYLAAARIQAGAVTSDKLTVADGFIKTAMIADAAITNAKIGALDAAKITTGTLAAARIGAGSITSDKLTIATGFIQTVMIADAAITDAKIGSLSAAKITTGYLAAARIQAGSVTSDKLTIATGFIQTAMIADASITDAKIGSLSAAKITTGTLAAARIAAGSITSDKLTIANAFIQTAMIADVAVTSAKIAALDAAKITTGTLLAARIAAGSITADKLAANAMQVGLAGWTSSIRITPTQIAWYNGTSLEGSLTSTGMRFYSGTRYIGEMARRAKKDAESIQGIVNQLSNTGDYVSWTYQTAAGGDYYTCLTLDPKGTFYGQKGIHLGADLRTQGYKMFTSGNRYVTLQDCALTDLGTFPGWVGQGTAKLVFATNNLIYVTGGSYYSFMALVARMNDLMGRMNSLIGRLNNGWVTKITDQGGGKITWSFYSNTGLTTMATTLS